jgi:hypothetical protein
MNTPLNRRHFLRTAAGTAAATGALLGAARGAGIDPAQKLKVGFIGTGGRGTGAVVQALSADDNIVLHSVADVFQDKIDGALGQLAKDKNVANKVEVPKERQFVGLDGYKRVLDSGVDVVLLTTTPGFRPLHLRAAIEAGKHVFAEKPMAVDAAGARYCLESLKMAEGKPISIVAGFCWRYSPSRREAYKKVMEEGLIGDVVGVADERVLGGGGDLGGVERAFERGPVGAERGVGLGRGARAVAGAVERGVHYLQQYPGIGGWLLFAVCPIAVFMAGARILDSVEHNSAP